MILSAEEEMQLLSLGIRHGHPQLMRPPKSFTLSKNSMALLLFSPDVFAERLEIICPEILKGLGEPLETACVLVTTPFSVGSITYNI